MKRTPLRRGDKPLERRTRLKAHAVLERHTPIRKRNPERLARLEERHFGDYGAYIASLACIVTGTHPVHRAHVLGTRGAGHGPEGLAPLAPWVHRLFDDGLVSDARFQQETGVSRADIRAWAQASYEAWTEGR